MIILPSRNGMLLRNSNGILAADCGGPQPFTCDCELLTGSNCSCYGTDLTPSTYIADFGEMGKFCLEWQSGCIWQVTVSNTTVTLNLAYATNTTRLTVVVDSTAVFSGDIVGTDCDDRKYGVISNTVSPSDWGDGTFVPRCSGSTCISGRLIELNVDFGEIIGIAYYAAGSSSILYVPEVITIYGYLSNVSSNCVLTRNIDVDYHKFFYDHWTDECLECQRPPCDGTIANHITISLTYNPSTNSWGVSVSVPDHPNVYSNQSGYFFSGGATQDPSLIGIGESFAINNTQMYNSGRSMQDLCLSENEYAAKVIPLDTEYNVCCLPGTATIIIY